MLSVTPKSKHRGAPDRRVITDNYSAPPTEWKPNTKASISKLFIGLYMTAIDSALNEAIRISDSVETINSAIDIDTSSGIQTTIENADTIHGSMDEDNTDSCDAGIELELISIDEMHEKFREAQESIVEKSESLAEDEEINEEETLEESLEEECRDEESLEEDQKPLEEDENEPGINFETELECISAEESVEEKHHSSKRSKSRAEKEDVEEASPESHRYLFTRNRFFAAFE